MMSIAFLYSVVALAIVALTYLALSRVRLSRRVGSEAIEEKEVAEAFNRISLWPQFRLLRGMVVRRLAGYRPRGEVVDVGCGPGYLVEAVLKRLPDLQVVGIDYSKEMVQTARKRAEASRFTKRSTFLQGDVAKLPLRDASVGFVVSSLSLHHWSNPQEGFAEIYRVLRPNGQLLLFDLRRDTARMFYGLLRFAQAVVVPAALRRVNEPLGSLLAAYSVAEMKEMIASTPFEKSGVIGGIGWAYVWAKKEQKAG